MVRRRSLRWQLIVPLNAAVALIVSAFLVWDGVTEYHVQIAGKRSALQEEAAIIAPVAQRMSRNPQDLQGYVDDVCGRAQQTSPGHHVAVQVGDEVFQAHSNHKDPPAMLAAMQAAAADRSGRAVAEDGRIVVGAARRGATTVWVSEHLDDVLRDLWRQVLRRVLSLMALAAAIALVVNLMVTRHVARPLRAVVDAARRLKAGRLGVQAPVAKTEELSFLVGEFNAMSAALAAADRERRLQMEKARLIQERLLPPPDIGSGLRLACVYEPATEVGGDYFDILPRNGGLILAVADVTGHGVPAAMGAAMLKMLLVGAAERTAEPERLLEEVNKGFAAVTLPEDFASMMVAVVDPGGRRVRYASAGHPAAYFLRPGHPVKALPSTGPLLAIPVREPWHTVELAVQPGDRLLMVTDGLAEAANVQGQFLGQERLATLVEETRSDPLDKACRRLVDRIMLFRGAAAQSDDMTVLGVEF
jgi:sigma-B regulation protein RsbU (phosphoserine phosphatase)